MSNSVLDDLGKEVTGILTPVSLCMALTVALVKTLNSDSESNSDSVLIASAYYEEQEEDSAGTKLGGSIVNALIFIAFITFLTFVLFFLFKYGCVNCIYGYMGFVLLDVFFFLAGTVVVKLLQELNLHIDAVSLCLILFNFSVVGALGLFFWKIPIVVKQGYLVLVGVLVAYIFTAIPEWSTWVLLVFMSLYDICAVLIPGGPLKALVELAVERGEDIPALVYEVRPTRGGTGGWEGRYQQQPEGVTNYVSQMPSASLTAAVNMASLGSAESDGDDAATSDIETMNTAETAIIGPNQASSSSLPAGETRSGENSSSRPERNRNRRTTESTRVAAPEVVDPSESGTDPLGFGLPDSLKLGLGDFIFYSVLVGRAAFYDFMTAYVGIIAGMGLTLLLLALYRRALPALPFSIVLGLVFYFLTRLVLEPFIVSLALSLTFF